MDTSVDTECKHVCQPGEEGDTNHGQQSEMRKGLAVRPQKAHSLQKGVKWFWQEEFPEGREHSANALQSCESHFDVGWGCILDRARVDQ